MEQNDKNTLQEMQEQFNLLHSKLENQTILDDKQLARIPRMRIKSMKAVSSFWLVLAIVILILIDGFYGLYYYSLIHIDKVVNYFETTYMAPIDSIINLPSDQLSPELQERLKNMNPEQVEQIRESHTQFRRTLDWFKSETINNPEGMQEAIENVKSAIYGGWILVLNILISLFFIAIIVTQIFNIRFLNRGKIQQNISSLTEQIQKVRTTHIISCATITMLIALTMPLILMFYENVALGWKILLITLPAVLSCLEILQLTPLKKKNAIRYLDWGRVFYIRHTCDEIIRKMEETL